MPPLMLAGLRFMLVAFPALLFVARLAIPLPVAGYGLTISFGQFAFLFCAIGLGDAGGAGVAELQAQAFFYHHSWRLRLWRTLTGQAAGGDRAGDLRRAGAGGGSLGGEYVPLVGFMLTLAAALSLRQYFQQKIMSQATRPPIISLVVWSALIPVLPFMFASWLIDGPQLMLASLRQIDMLTVLAALPGVYRRTSSAISGARCWGAMKILAGGAAVAAGAGSGDGQRRAAAGGDAERTAARRGGADHGRALYQRFRSASGAAWHGARVKKSPGDGAIHKYACNGITGRAAGSTARQVRQIYHCRPPYD